MKHVELQRITVLPVSQAILRKELAIVCRIVILAISLMVHRKSVMNASLFVKLVPLVQIVTLVDRIF